LLGLESTKPSTSVEIIYGDRLSHEQALPQLTNWFDFNGQAQPKGAP
jgi:hypothetical protein